MPASEARTVCPRDCTHGWGVAFLMVLPAPISMHCIPGSMNRVCFTRRSRLAARGASGPRERIQT